MSSTDSAMPTHSTTTPSETYTAHQETVLRVLSVTSSSVSLFFGLVACYLFINMRRRVFRHHLIMLLLLSDAVKACVLLWFPARTLTTPSAYDNVNFCDVVGVFTTFAIQLADFSVFFIAIHTALLVFFTNNGPEGGLYKYRYYVYGITIALPIFMACIAFVGNGRGSYRPYVTWCYLPQQPVWYRLVLSWVPRYIIIVTILAIYISIYFYVRMQLKEVIRNFSQSQKYAGGGRDTTPKSWPRRAYEATLGFISNFPGFAFLQDRYGDAAQAGVGTAAAPGEIALETLPHGDISETSGASGASGASGTTGMSGETPVPLRADTDNPASSAARQSSAIVEFQRESMMKFEIRRNVIERQVRSVFVYPMAYVVLWAFPFALQCVQYNPDRHSIFWLSGAAAFMQPFNCTVDTIAFCIRETPWRDRVERVFTLRYVKLAAAKLRERRRRASDPGGLHEADNNEEKNLAFGRTGTALSIAGPSRAGPGPDGRVLRGQSTSSTLAPLARRAPTDLSPKGSHFPPFQGPFEPAASSGDDSDEEIDIFEFLR